MALLGVQIMNGEMDKLIYKAGLELDFATLAIEEMVFDKKNPVLEYSFSIGGKHLTGRPSEEKDSFFVLDASFFGDAAERLMNCFGDLKCFEMILGLEDRRFLATADSELRTTLRLKSFF